MPPIPEVIATLDEIKELHKRKNDDYSGSMGPRYNFEVAKWLMNQFDNPDDKVYAALIGIKLGRLAVLLNKEYRSGEAPKNESTGDSFNDDIGYTAIWKSDWMNRKKNSRLSQSQIEKSNTV